MKVVNLETIIDMQSWCRTWPPNGSSCFRAKQELLRKYKGACKSSWSRIGCLKSFTLTIPWNLEKPVKIVPGIIVHRHNTDQKQKILKDAVHRVTKRHLCRIVAIRSGRKLVGRFYGMLYLSAKHSRSLVCWENSIREFFFGKPLKSPIIPFGSLVEYYPILAKDQSRIHQFGKEVVPWIVL